MKKIKRKSLIFQI